MHPLATMLLASSKILGIFIVSLHSAPVHTRRNSHGLWPLEHRQGVNLCDARAPVGPAICGTFQMSDIVRWCFCCLRCRPCHPTPPWLNTWRPVLRPRKSSGNPKSAVLCHVPGLTAFASCKGRSGLKSTATTSAVWNAVHRGHVHSCARVHASPNRIERHTRGLKVPSVSKARQILQRVSQT